MPFTTAGDASIGPGVVKDQIFLPVAARTAKTWWSKDPKYTSPPVTAREDSTLAAVWKFHFLRSLATLPGVSVAHEGQCGPPGQLAQMG